MRPSSPSRLGKSPWFGKIYPIRPRWWWLVYLGYFGARSPSGRGLMLLIIAIAVEPTGKQGKGQGSFGHFFIPGIGELD